MFTLAQSYNSGYRRRTANRYGEFRHEEFSHCCIHESVGRETFRRSLSYHYSWTITLKFLAKGGEQIENVKETAKNCSKNVISCFSSVLFLVLSETKRR